MKVSSLQERQRIVQEVSAQVSHDIRSPLAALEMISGSLQELSEDKRLIIRNSINRIRDISHSLLDKNRMLTPAVNDHSNSQNEGVPTIPFKEEFTTSLLSPLIDSIVTEKRIQYRNYIGIKIDFQQTKESYGLFSNIQPNEFKRVLSNLINNSVEALHNHHGSVEIILQSNPTNRDQIELLIKDNGKGILPSILPKLGERGETHGKEGGSGLGLFHAKETIEAGGSLKIASNMNAETTVTITILRKIAPDWFVAKIELKPGQTLIAFDDDQSVHQIWKGRIESLPNHDSIILRHFTDPNELRKFYSKNFTDLESALFLMDYEISGTHESGLDVIETLGIQKQSILVTSRYEEKIIRERCETLGIHLIPKNMSGFVPLEINP